MLQEIKPLKFPTTESELYAVKSNSHRFIIRQGRLSKSTPIEARAGRLGSGSGRVVRLPIAGLRCMLGDLGFAEASVYSQSSIKSIRLEKRPAKQLYPLLLLTVLDRATRRQISLTVKGKRIKDKQSVSLSLSGRGLNLYTGRRL